MATVVVHGGAGKWADSDEESVRQSLREALESGKSALRTHTPVKAVVEAVKVLEDNPAFNAGTGSCLNFRGEAEMDAALMDGETLEAGAVANIRQVKHPIAVARDVMEATDHVLLGGKGAKEFAQVKGHETYDPVTSSRREQYEERKEKFLDGESTFSLPKLRELIDQHPELTGGTVGAVARDSDGRLAAATSTGGVFLKWPGRIGDSPLVGSGTYASTDAAVSATGRGEIITRYTTARRVAERFSEGVDPNTVVETILTEIDQRFGPHVGLISLDADGNVGIDHLTERMPHGWIRSDGASDVSMGVDG